MRGEREGGAWGTRGLTLFRTDSLLSLPEGIDWTRICIPDFTLPMVVPREVLRVHMFIHACVCVCVCVCVLYMNSIPNKWSTVKLQYLVYFLL